jgi:hypothetical protein
MFDENAINRIEKRIVRYCRRKLQRILFKKVKSKKSRRLVYGLETAFYRTARNESTWGRYGKK